MRRKLRLSLALLLPCLLLALPPLLPAPAALAAPAKNGKAAQEPAPVIVARVARDHFVDEVEALGTLRANESVILSSSVSDTVQAINFTDNQRVEKGTVLVEMTSAEESANLAQQRSVVTEAKKQLDRMKELVRQHAGARADLDERQRVYDSAKAGLDALQSRLEDHLIVAPFGGVLGLRTISVGALLQPGTRITTIDDDSVMKLDFTVPALFLRDLKPGLPIVAHTGVYPGEKFEGTISSIDSEIDPVSRSVTVRALLPNPGTRLRPGMLMTVAMYKNPRDTLSIPEIALIPEGRKDSVLLVDTAQNPPTVEKVEVRTGARRPGTVEILSGLKEGDMVVSHGTMTAQPGKPVRIVSEEKPGEKLTDMISKEQPAAGGDNNAEEDKNAQGSE
jgi:membrane fusion protein (multidrug efflux system)